MPSLDFNIIPSVGINGINIMVVGLTTRIVTNINGQLTLNFYIKENVGDRESNESWVETKHDANNRYLTNKMNSINQSIRSTVYNCHLSGSNAVCASNC